MKFGEIDSTTGGIFWKGDYLTSGVLGLAYGGDGMSVDNLHTFFDNASVTDKSFSFYLHAVGTQSYMVIPGMDTTNFGTIDTHKVAEEKYWALDIDFVRQGENKVINAFDYFVTLDTGAAIIQGPKEIMDPFLEGITVNADCSGQDDLPTLTWAIDGTPYTLDGKDYVIKTQDGKCELGVKSVAMQEGQNYIALGAPFLRKYPTYFNLNDNSVSFQVAL